MCILAIDCLANQLDYLITHASHSYFGATPYPAGIKMTLYLPLVAYWPNMVSW